MLYSDDTLICKNDFGVQYRLMQENLSNWSVFLKSGTCVYSVIQTFLYSPAVSPLLLRITVKPFNSGHYWSSVKMSAIERCPPYRGLKYKSLTVA